MRFSRLVTAEFVGVFLIGTIVGGLVIWDSTDTTLSQFMSKTNDPDSVIVARIVDRYRNEYHLNEEELKKVNPLIQEMAQHVSKVRRDFASDIITTLDTYHAKIADELAPEHREAYVKAVEERKKKVHSMLLLDTGSPTPATN